MHKNVLAAAVADDEPEPFIRVVPFHRADLLDGRLVRRSIRWSLRSRPPRLLLERGGRINAQDLGYLHALLARSRPDLKRGAGRHGTVAAALDNTDVEEGIASTRQLDKPQAPVPVVPLHHGRYGRTTRSRLEAGAARARCIAEIRRWRVAV